MFSSAFSGHRQSTDRPAQPSADARVSTGKTAAHTGTTVLHVAFEQWVNDPGHAPFQQIARDTLAQFREIAATG